jgi:hypothetical protein
MRFFWTNFVVTLSAYGLTFFLYPAGATVVPRILLLWAAPILGTLAGSSVARATLLGAALEAEALAFYTVIGLYCVVYYQKSIIDTLQYVTTAYFLPGALLALLVGIFAKCIISALKFDPRKRR